MKILTDGQAFALHCLSKQHGISSEAVFDIASWGYRMGLRDMRERAAATCYEYSAVKWDEYKRGNGPGRADPRWQGLSDGAGDCASRIEDLPIEETP